ncbi:MAG: hypothetical protein HRT53_10700 [Colwellia sp.]|nr:hypothetical protein [Colwellia sp.]
MTDTQADIPAFLKNRPTYIAMETLNLLASSIKNHKIKLAYAPLSRMDYLLKNKKNLCVTNRIKNSERESFGFFSLPLNLYPGLRLYYVEDKIGATNKIPKQLFNKQGQLISLSTLFKALPKNKLAIGQSRSYGKFLDKEIAALAQENIYRRSGENEIKAIIHMLAQKRIDFFIGFPTDFNVVSKKIEKSVNFKSIEIANSPRFILGHLVCNKTPKNELFIGEINKLLLALYKTDAFYQAHIKYLDHSDIVKFKQYYQEVFLSY